MVEVEMTKDIKNYEPRLIGPFTTRQVILLAIGLAYAVPMAIWLPIEDITIRILVAVVALAPMIACGWLDMMGMRLEMFVYQAFIKRIFRPKERVYEVDESNPYMTMVKEEQPLEAKKKKLKVKKSKKYVGRK